MVSTTILVDDMDGSLGATERHFSLGGMDYAVHLIDDNWSAMLKTMEPWRSIASPARKPRKQAHRPLTSQERKHLRLWADTNGIRLAERGRFPNDIVKRFLKEMETEDPTVFV